MRRTAASNSSPAGGRSAIAEPEPSTHTDTHGVSGASDSTLSSGTGPLRSSSPASHEVTDERLASPTAGE